MVTKRRKWRWRKDADAEQHDVLKYMGSLTPSQADIVVLQVH